MRAGDEVRWYSPAGRRVGVLVRWVPAGEAATLPDGVARRWRRFREGLALIERALVRERGTGLYYAPHRASLEAVA